MFHVYVYANLPISENNEQKKYFSTLKDNKLKDKIDKQQIVCVVNKTPLQKYSPGFL